VTKQKFTLSKDGWAKGRKWTNLGRPRRHLFHLFLVLAKLIVKLANLLVNNCCPCVRLEEEAEERKKERKKKRKEEKKRRKEKKKRKEEKKKRRR